MNASLSVVCYKSKTLSTGKHPLMLRICKDRKLKYISLGISIHAKDWDFTKNEPKPKCPDGELIQKIILDKKVEYQKQILEFNAEQKEYTATSLAESKKKKYALKTVKEFYNQLIDDFKTEGKIGNWKVYKTSYNNLKNFTNLDIPFGDIDVAWLNRYESWFKSKGCKETTISLQFRTLRSAYNKAIQAKAVSNRSYPFNEYKISKFDTSTEKRAISKEDIIKIMQLDLVNQSNIVQFSRDLFMFSYLTGGINFSDVANLKIDNIVDNQLQYKRQKTGKRINLTLQAEALKILNHYSANRNKDNYLFPILDIKRHITPMQKANRKTKILRQVNSGLKDIAKLANIKSNLTTYVSRHSFATVLKNSGVSVALISEALGHSDLATTQIYLDSFDSKQVEEAMNCLL